MNRNQWLSIAVFTLSAFISTHTYAADNHSAKDVVSGFPELQTGKDVFHNVCAACHMHNAQGAQGAGKFPALANNANLAAPTYMAFVLTHGLRGMPSFATYLNNQQIADVINYVRTNFGNQYTDTITADSVAQFRQ